MIGFLRGRVAARGVGFCMLDVNGVGYRLAMSTGSLASLPSEGDEVLVYTYLHVREDELSLFGFENEAEKSAFERLITVSGVGPKVALATLSAMSSDALAAAVESGDVAAISSVPGIGKKTAQRIILDLAGKLTGDDGTAAAPYGGAIAEVTEALLVMGFSAAESGAAVKGYDGDPHDSQGLLTHALKRLGGGS